MKIDALIDHLSDIRKTVGDNIEVLLLDPSEALGTGNSQWIGDFKPIPQTFDHGDGRLEAICLLLPRPSEAMVESPDGSMRPFEDASVGLKETPHA